MRLQFNRSGFPIQRLDFDFDGDGQLDRIAADSSEVTTAFSSARPFLPRGWVTMPSGVELSVATRVLVDLPTQTSAPFAQGNPIDLAPAPGGDLYVLDRSAATISRYTIDGQLVSRSGSPGTGAQQLLNPEGLAIGPGPRIYVADTGNDRIQVFRLDGSFERTFASSGAAPGHVLSPRGVEVTGDELIVSDAGNDRVQAISLDGRKTRAAHLVDPRGVADIPGAGVSIASPSMGLFALTQTRLRSAELAQLLSQQAKLSRPYDVAPGEGLVVIADGGARRVVVLDDGLRLRRVLPISGAFPIAVLPSSRREVESVFVADGAAVREIHMPVPSPVPVVQALRSRLLAGDTLGALVLITPLQRDRFNTLYHGIEADLPSDAAAMGAMTVDLVRGDRAIVKMATVIAVGGANVPTRVPVYLVRAEDGTWQILDY